MTEPIGGAEADPSGPHRFVLVVGSARSGSSSLARSLQILGMHVPQPEVAADDLSPAGTGESQWVAELHDRLLKRVNVAVSDARPQAWFDTGRFSTNDRLRETVKAWTASQFSPDVTELVLQDPRLPWFLGLWRSATLRLGIEPAYVVTLRSPTEVIGSPQQPRSAPTSASGRAAGWVNLMLHTERATRGSRRVFVRHEDLLEDWTVPVHRLGEDLELEAVRSAASKDIRRVHDFLGPDLDRLGGGWEDLDVPTSLRTVVEETWHHLDRLGRGKDDPARSESALDDIRLEYTRLYEEAEAFAESSVLASRRTGRTDRRGAARGGPGSPGSS